MEIRYFQDSDIPDLVKLVEEFQLEYGCLDPVGGINSVTFLEQLNFIKEFLRVWVVADKNNIIAALAMVEFLNPFSGLKALEELFWFSLPIIRSSNNLLIVRHMEDYAQAEGVQYIAMSSMQGINTDKMHKFYTRRGFRLHQRQYFKTLKGEKL